MPCAWTCGGCGADAEGWSRCGGCGHLPPHPSALACLADDDDPLQLVLQVDESAVQRRAGTGSSSEGQRAWAEACGLHETRRKRRGAADSATLDQLLGFGYMTRSVNVYTC